ncbi:MAG: phosphoribosylamine--glycine ligase [Bacteroidetes bacterium GWE2_29_8]|nr:MAG: phosphoribosylamine--glycine ligase [Bacteroidetes bacterium GWE2_29_8]OFY18066.1 MAG: phosphoribosylamine--glycine ligase [Bacteroidetes bacterium GWF2_29_10]
MNILILGSGGREHALAWKIKQSHKLKNLYVAPGNGGTSAIAQNVNINPNDFNTIKDFVISNNVNMVIVGPEDPLVKGIYDFFTKDKELNNVSVIAPSKEASKLEGSKDFSKYFMSKYKIPTADYKTFDKENISLAIEYLNTLEAPYVIKADGLAAGKGVVICNSKEEALVEIESMILNGKFGEAGEKVVIEEFLKGIELSAFIISDGKNYKMLPQAKDYKRIGDGDIGLNTGGMGAVSPVYFADKNFVDKIEKNIVIPVLNGLKKEGIEYKGFLFIGIMNVNNNPYVIEFNVRLGDPEAEVIIPRIKNDIIELFESVANQSLDNFVLDINDNYASTVILVSDGYPLNFEKNKEIKGLNDITDAIVFHAGTVSNDGKIFSNGGRVLAVTSIDNSLNNALQKCYNNINKIKYQNKYYRKDIGLDLMKLMQ